MRAIEALAHERTIARLRQEFDEDSHMEAQVMPYNPATVYLLETLVSIVTKVPQYLDDTW